MKKIIILFIIFISKTLTAQTIQGTVSDSTGGSAIEGVSVFIPELQKFAITDEKGAYKFENTGVGLLTIQFSKLGYKTIVKTINAAESASLNISLSRTSMELEEVVITGNNSRLADNLPYSVNTIQTQELRNTAAPSLMQQLSYQPGIDLISVGNGIGKPVIRGLSFNRVMLYTMGTRIENQQWDDRHDLGVSEIGLEKVEVINGPAALIYGADALGGALVFVDEKPAANGTKSGDANIAFFSNTLGLNADAGLKGTSTKGLFYSVRGGINSHTSYLQGEDEDAPKTSGETEAFAPNSKYQDMAAKATLGISRKWGVSKLSYSYLNSLKGIIEDESANTSATKVNDEAEQRDREMEAPYQDVTTHIIALENTYLMKHSKINLNLSYETNDRKEFEPLPEKQKELAFGLKLNVITYDLKWTSNPEKAFGVTIGTQGMTQKNENFGKEILVPDAEASDYGVYSVFRYDYKKFNFLAGLRFDSRSIKAEGEKESGEEEEDSVIFIHAMDTVAGRPELELEKDYTPISGSLGFAFHPSERWTLKVNGATGYRAPNYAEIGTFGKHEGFYRFEVGDPELKMEQNVEGDLGIQWEGDFVSLHTSAYYNSISNYIYIENTGEIAWRLHQDDLLRVYDYKQANANISGFELGVDIHPSTLKWLDIRASYATMTGKLDAGGYLPFMPADKIISELKLSKTKMGKLLNPYISFVNSYYFEQIRISEFESPTGYYDFVDVHVGADFKIGKQTIGAQLFCNNVTNLAYFNHLSLIKNINVHEMGRNIGVQLHIPFGL